MLRLAADPGYQDPVSPRAFRRSRCSRQAASRLATPASPPPGRGLSAKPGALVRLAGFEPATRCLEGTLQPSPEEARCGLTRRLAALMEADCRLVYPHIWRRWLPTWLPANSSHILNPRRSGLSIASAMPGRAARLADLTWDLAGGIRVKRGDCRSAGQIHQVSVVGSRA